MILRRGESVVQFVYIKYNVNIVFIFRLLLWLYVWPPRLPAGDTVEDMVPRATSTSNSKDTTANISKYSNNITFFSCFNIVMIANDLSLL